MKKSIIFSAPSGAGKTTILREIMKKRNDCDFSISATSRAPRGNEKNGVDYHFLSIDEFKTKILNNEFVEYEEVYTDVFYGTLTEELEKIWQKGHHVFFDVDVIGGLKLRNIFNNTALALFIQPPSMQILEKRLRNRSTDSEESIQKRLAKAKYELTFAAKFDQIIVNNDLNQAIAKTETIINNFLNT